MWDVEENVKYIAVYPAYVVVRGPSQEVSVPLIRDQPSWSNELFPCGSGIEKGLGHLFDVPRLRQEREGEVDLQDSLPLKQKLAPLLSVGEGSSPASSLCGVFSPIREVCHEHVRLKDLVSSKGV